MEANPPKIGKFALNYGLILGGIIVVFSIMLYLQDLHYQQGIWNAVVSFVLTLVVVTVAMMQFRKANEGKLSFGQAIKIGVGAALISAVVGIVWNLVLTQVIDPETTEKALAYAEEQMRTEYNLNQEQIDAQLSISRKMAAPYIQVPFALIASVIFGFLASLIPALVLKKS
jgi:hypothetical protein